MDRMEVQHEADSAPEPSPAIRAYLEALLTRWPDITDARGDDSPWAEGPLMLSGSGDIAYFSMVFSRADEGVEHAARVAAEHGLVCYDPQLEELVS